AFFGLGAYAAGLLHVDLGMNFWAAIPLAMVPSALMGALIAFASLRLSGAYFAICSLAFAEIIRLIAESWIDLTRGPLGVPIPRPPIVWWREGGLSFPQYYLFIGALIRGLAGLWVARLLNSPAGTSWKAIRGSLALAESVGVPTLHCRIQALVISGGLAALA